jgi:hypothetical protein
MRVIVIRAEPEIVTGNHVLQVAHDSRRDILAIGMELIYFYAIPLMHHEKHEHND